MSAPRDHILQTALNDGYRGRCTLEDRKQWACCTYHLNRAECVAFAITDDAVEGGRNNASVRSTPDIVKMSRLFDSGTPPAGSWYLVKEQRDWLADQVAQKIRSVAAERNLKRTPIRILESGIASYVHHFTYLHILHEVLQRLKMPEVSIELVVIDRCGYPLAQVRTVEERMDLGYYHPGTVYVGNKTLQIPASVAALLQQQANRPSRISTSLIEVDLANPNAVMDALDESGEEPTFDLVTEHFLTSVLRKNIRDFAIRQTRETYRRLLRPSGRLLAAVGFRARTRVFRDMIKMHEEADLIVHRASRKRSWDPYGLTPEQIGDFQVQSSVSVSLDNTLVRFDRAA